MMAYSVVSPERPARQVSAALFAAGRVEAVGLTRKPIMTEAFSTGLMGVVFIFGGMYLALRFIVLAEAPKAQASPVPPTGPLP